MQQKNNFFVTALTLLLVVIIICPTSVDAATRTSSSRRQSSALQQKINKLDDDIEDHIKIPVIFGTTLLNISDTWGDARSNGRTHEGTDLLAPRGTPIVSPTEAVVVEIGYGDNGGNYLYTANPGGERYYFAHLDSYKEGIKVGDELDQGDIIGYVGNTGNAAGGPTHLHFGIYANHGAINPFPRLDREFSLKEKIDVLYALLDDLKDQLEEAKKKEAK